LRRGYSPKPLPPTDHRRQYYSQRPELTAHGQVILSSSLTRGLHEKKRTGGFQGREQETKTCRGRSQNPKSALFYHYITKRSLRRVEEYNFAETPVLVFETADGFLLRRSTGLEQAQGESRCRGGTVSVSRERAYCLFGKSERCQGTADRPDRWKTKPGPLSSKTPQHKKAVEGLRGVGWGGVWGPDVVLGWVWGFELNTKR